MKKITSLTVEVRGSSAPDLDGLTAAAIQDALVDLSGDDTSGGGTDIVDDNGDVVGRITWASSTASDNGSTEATASTGKSGSTGSKSKGVLGRLLGL